MLLPVVVVVVVVVAVAVAVAATVVVFVTVAVAVDAENECFAGTLSCKDEHVDGEAPELHEQQRQRFQR